MILKDLNDQLVNVDYSGKNVIDLTSAKECNESELKYTKLDEIAYKLEFKDLQENEAKFDCLSKIDRKLLKQTIIQANAGRIILTEVKDEKRAGVSKGKPVGWEHNFIVCNASSQKDYFYHRTHILGDLFTKNKASYYRGEIFLGTRLLNAAPKGESMKTYEEKIAKLLIKNKGKALRIFYRVVPIFRNNEALPRGVRLTAVGEEGSDSSIIFDVFIFNVYRGYRINYSTGSVQNSKRLGFKTRRGKVYAHRR